MESKPDPKKLKEGTHIFRQLLKSNNIELLKEHAALIYKKSSQSIGAQAEQLPDGSKHFHNGKFTDVTVSVSYHNA